MTIEQNTLTPTPKETLKKVVIISSNILDRIDAPLRDGYSKKYRGNHRSENKGAGIKAFFRNLWMKRYHR